MDLTDCAEGKELLKQSEDLLELSKAAFKMSGQEKNSIHQSRTGSMFGFKSSGAIAIPDPHQRKDRGEMLNISKNDTMRETPSISYVSSYMIAMKLKPYRRIPILEHWIAC